MLVSGAGILEVARENPRALPRPGLPRSAALQPENPGPRNAISGRFMSFSLPPIVFVGGGNNRGADRRAA